MSSPTVDVLIPVWNGARTIESAVQSIQLQSFDDIRIFVVDDGSTDATAEILAELASGDARIQVITKPNGGIVEALNVGLQHCTAEFVARHDADDIAYPERFAQQIHYLRHHPDCLALAGSARHIDADGKPIGTIARLDPPDRADPTAIPAKEPYLMHPFLMVRREALNAVGGYRDLPHSQDSDLYWRLQEVGGLYNDPKVHGDYRIHPDSSTSQSIASGRRTAVCSQLSALSARRRRAGRPDIVFDRSLADRLRAPDIDLATACDVASAQLDATEARHLRVAAAAKLLELADYRPFELETSDCAFIAETVSRDDGALGAEQRRRLRKAIDGTAARLARAGRWREARALAGPGVHRIVATRLLIRALVPDRLYRRLRVAFKTVLALGRKPRAQARA